MSEIEIKITSIIKSITNIEGSIDDETVLLSQGINSIVFIKIVIAIEKEFNIEFDDEALDISRISNFKDLVMYVKDKLQKE